ncbi:unnamed protein product [Linum trigynum]|uniref:Uncharacterized protein n=1 Tax=Linum trigynum TaxID=586398 RepID=A0AAV2E8Y7_9ROSI
MAEEVQWKVEAPAVASSAEVGNGQVDEAVNPINLPLSSSANASEQLEKSRSSGRRGRTNYYLYYQRIDKGADDPSTISAHRPLISCHYSLK